MTDTVNKITEVGKAQWIAPFKENSLHIGTSLPSEGKAEKKIKPQRKCEGWQKDSQKVKEVLQNPSSAVQVASTKEFYEGQPTTS